MRLQRTLTGDVVFRGVGLHSGVPAIMRLCPAPRDTGILFYRTDKGVYVRAHLHAVTDTAFATTISGKGVSVRTIEHLMAAASALGVDNMLIELSGPEVPIMDGSAKAFCDGIMGVGLAKQASNLNYIKLTQSVYFRDGQTEIAAYPYDGRKVSYHINFDHQFLGEQSIVTEIEPEGFASLVAPARTFGFASDVMKLQSMGLAKGGSLDNAILLSDTGIVNPTGLRFKDEFVRHKLLDFIGDISLMGMPIHAHFAVSRSGHTSNVKFLRHLIHHSECWEMVTGVEEALQATA